MFKGFWTRKEAEQYIAPYAKRKYTYKATTSPCIIEGSHETVQDSLRSVPYIDEVAVPKLKKSEKHGCMFEARDDQMKRFFDIRKKREGSKVYISWYEVRQGCVSPYIKLIRIGKAA